MVEGTRLETEASFLMNLIVHSIKEQMKETTSLLFQ